MERTAALILVLALLMGVSKCAEIGLAHRNELSPDKDKNWHYEIFHDGFLLDDEEILEGKPTKFSVQEGLGEQDGPKDLIPMIDPEADTDKLIKFEDFAIPRSRLRKTVSRNGRAKRFVWDYDYVKWPEGVIPYEIHEGYYTKEQVNLIHRAMALWENGTCIRFVEHTNQQSYLIIVPGAGCYSIVGRYGGAQRLSLGPSCFYSPGTAVHELGHAIGLYHEHSRYDRNQFVYINYDNIRPGVDVSQFDIIDFPGFTNLGLPYDYNSIMHYDDDQGAKDPAQGTIEAHDPNIIVGNAIVPSPLDYLKVNTYYQCKAPFPPKTTNWTSLPPKEDEIPPRPHKCGGLIQNKLSGAFSTPDFPQLVNDQCCSWQIVAPEGYRLKINITSFGLSDHYTTSCDDGNITFLQLDSTKRIFSRICRYSSYNDRPYYTRHNEAHIIYCSGKASQNSPKKGFSASFETFDINECEGDNDCSHQCINTPGGYTCACDSGYYLSADQHTCFDINECTINDKLCDYRCRNYGGYYQCICPDGSYQTGSSCSSGEPAVEAVQAISYTIMAPPTTTKPPPTTTMPPPTTTMPPPTTTMPSPTTTMPPPTTTKPPPTTTKPPPTTTMPPPTTTLPPTTNRPTTMKPTTVNPTTMKPTTKVSTTMESTTLPITTSIPTTKSATSTSPDTKSPTIVTTQPSSVVTTHLTGLQGEFTSPNWPETYPVNQELQWIVSCPSDYIVELDLRKDPFGIAGDMPDCHKDYVQVHDGDSLQGNVLGKFCHFSLPPVLLTTSNIATVKFYAGPQHSSSRRGFSASYKCLYQCPTLQMPSLPKCGSHMKANSGVVSSPNWPNTYNVNEQCEWIIELPDCQKVIEIEFTGFSVAGKMPSCPKDQLYVDDGIGDDSQTHGPFCHMSLPPKIRTTSNVARFRFNAGPQHGALRFGFSAHFRAVDK